MESLRGPNPNPQLKLQIYMFSYNKQTNKQTNKKTILIVRYKNVKEVLINSKGTIMITNGTD